MTHSLLSALARGIARRPLTVVALGALACALLGGLAVARLQFKTARVALVGDVPFVRQQLELEEEFGDLNAIVVAIKGEDRAETRAVGDALEEAIAQAPDRFRGSFHRVAPDAFGGRALLFLDAGQLSSLETLLGRLLPELRHGALAGCLAGFASELEARLEEGDQAEGGAGGELASWARRLLDEAHAAASGQPPAKTALDTLPVWDTAGYAWAGDGETLIVLVDFLEIGGDLDPRAQSVNRLRELVAALRTRFPDVELGVTGKPALEVDEMRTYEADSLRATLAALIGVTLLLVLAFRRWIGPLLIGACLALAVAATLGLASIWPGHLNLMAVVFVVVVIGLGVDFGIHLASRYDEALGAGESPAAALHGAFVGVGPAIIAGGLTTVGAFAVAFFTEFKGLQEFGVVAALGVIASLAVMLTVLPGLLVIFDRKRSEVKAPRPPAVFRLLDHAVVSRPGATLLVVLGLCVVAAALAPRLRYESNLLLMQDQRLDSVKLELSLLRDRDTTGWFLAHTTQDVEHMRQVAALARSLPGVRRVESILDVLPAGQAANLKTVRAIQAQLSAALPEPPPPSSPVALRASLERLRTALEEALEASLGAGREEALATLEDLLLRCEAALSVLDGPEAAEGLAAYDRRLGELLAARTRTVAEPPAALLTPETLPTSLRNRLVGTRGSYLLRIYPETDLWDPLALAEFVRTVRAAIPDVTGVPILMHESSRLMLRGYVDAGLYALCVVIVCVLVLTRSVRWTLLTLLALAVGGLWTVGLMALFGIDLNPANLVALPLLLGVGIDTSVHVVHRLREGTGRGMAFSSLGRALLYSGLTSVAGFGSLMLADHPGTASIGSTISLGILGCLFAGLVVPHALVRLLRRDPDRGLE